VTAAATNHKTGEIWLGQGYLDNGSPRILKFDPTVSTTEFFDYSNGLESIGSGIGNLPINVIVYEEKLDIVIVGTDMGFFYRSNLMNEWKELGQGLPLVRVNDIYVNWNTFEIYVATYGRGCFKIAIPCCEDNSEIPVDKNIITNEVHEYESRFINENWIIKTGNSVTLTGCDYSFCEDCKIIIEPGASLIVDKTKLGPGCKNATWLGIEVWGDPMSYSSKTVQGYIDIKNSYLINAYNAILTGKFADNTRNGGLVFSTDNEFINCRFGVNIKPYGSPTMYNQSIIQTTKFIYKDLLWAGNGLNHHIAIVQTYGVRIIGCDFINISGNAANMDRGRGIQCVDGSFRLTGYVEYGPGQKPCEIPESEIRKNTFYGLSQGVNTIDFFQTPDKYSIISESNFKNCNTSVWINSTGVKKVNRNYIEVDQGLYDQDPLLYYNFQPIGIYSVDIGDLLIDSNHIKILPDYNKAEGFSGIYIKNTSAATQTRFAYMNIVEVDPLLGGPIEPLFSGNNQSYGLRYEESNPLIDIGCNTFGRLNYDLYFDVNPIIGEVVPNTLPVNSSFDYTDVFSDYDVTNTFNGYSNFQIIPSSQHIINAANFPSPLPRSFNIGTYASGNLGFSFTADNHLNYCHLTNRCAIQEYARTEPGQQEVLIGDGEIIYPGDNGNDFELKVDDDLGLVDNSQNSVLGQIDSNVQAIEFARIISDNYKKGNSIDMMAPDELLKIKGLFCHLESDERKKARVILQLNNSEVPECKIEEKTIQKDMMVYPNPNRGTFLIKFELGDKSNGIIEIKSSLGQALKTYPIESNSGTLEVMANWAPGIYFVTLTIQGGERITKAVSIY